MKFFRFMSALLFGLGCILSVIGLTTIVSPDTSNFLVQSFKRLMFLSSRQNWPVLYLGLLILAAAAELLLFFAPEKTGTQTASPLPVSSDQ